MIRHLFLLVFLSGSLECSLTKEEMFLYRLYSHIKEKKEELDKIIKDFSSGIITSKQYEERKKKCLVCLFSKNNKFWDYVKKNFKDDMVTASSTCGCHLDPCFYFYIYDNIIFEKVLTDPIFP